MGKVEGEAVKVDTPEIAVKYLEGQGFQEDRVAQRDFEKPYRWITVPGLILIVGSYPLARYVMQPRFFPGWDWSALIFWIALPGFLLLAGASLHAWHKIPTSRANGLPLTRYKRTDIDRSRVQSEYVYVDSTRKTYFTRVTAWQDYKGGKY